jgi:hypothetical protein
MTTGYEPLNTLKPWGEGLWLIDGPAVTFKGLPFSTRATVVQLANGDLWVQSPTTLTDALRAEITALGPVRHLVAPNTLHTTFLPDWRDAFPEATVWAVSGADLPRSASLHTGAEGTPWAGQIDQMIVEGSKTHIEAVFLHRASATLIVTDLIAAFETAKLPAWMRPIAWITGVDDSDGKMPPAVRRHYRDKHALARSVEQMIIWSPKRIVLAHGRCYEHNGVAELERAFRRILHGRNWDRALTQMKDRQK